MSLFNTESLNERAIHFKVERCLITNEVNIYLSSAGRRWNIMNNKTSFRGVSIDCLENRRLMNDDIPD